jgi:imidazolonepropionase-like amidohydrolase
MAAPEGGFAKLKAGETRALLEASSRAEAQRAIAFAKRHGLAGVVYGAGRIGELAPALKDAGLGAVLQPFAPGASRRTRRAAVELAAAGVPFGYALDNPGLHTVSLRAAAAAAMREGLSAEAAWTALTSGAAQLAGVADRVGAIAPGLDADLVLWSGPPTDLTSSAEAVWIDGEKVHGGDDE